LGTQAGKLVTPYGTCKVRTQNRHNYNDKQHKPDSDTPLNALEQFQPSSL